MRLTLSERGINKIARILSKLKHDSLFTFTLWSAKISRICNQNNIGGDINSDRKYLILDVSSEGSLGDEAMIIGSVDFLQDWNVKEVGILSAHNRQNWQGYEDITKALKVSFFSLDFQKNDGSSYHKFSKIARHYTNFVVPGADVMDGYYSEASPLLKLRLISLAHALSLNCSILGFSFNNEPKPSCVAEFQKLPKDITVNARDPFSKARLENHTGKQINLVADLAFLLKPSASNPAINQVESWIKQEQTRGNIVIGINPNKTLAGNLKVNTTSKLAAIFSDLIKNLAQTIENISFILIPHDYREDNLFPGDHTLSKLIKKQLPEEIQYKCFFKETRLKAAEVKYICQDLDLVITSRMHLAIACLGVSTPVLGIIYQGKFEGLYNYFELEEMLIEPRDATQPDELLFFVISGIENREKIKQQIVDKLPKVVDLAKRNFLGELH